MADLTDLIEAHWSTWADVGGPVVDRLLFGTGRAEEVAAIVTSWCATHLGSPVSSGRRWTTSVGSVAVVDLADGRIVVVKVHQPDRDRQFLRAVQDVQRAVAVAGIAAPQPLGGPAPIGPGGALATVDTFLPDPGITDGRAPGAADAAARALAVSIDATTELDLADVPIQPVPRGDLWPRPHSPIFDFAATADGAEWIDDLARRAVAQRDHGEPEPLVVGHLDWCSRNVRVADGAVVAAYDWDAVSWVAVHTVVGQSAALWPCTGEPDSPAASTPAELRSFIAAYDDWASRPLDATTHRRAAAAGLYALAYMARCEHAIGRASGSGTAALRTHGAAYLEALG